MDEKQKKQLIIGGGIAGGVALIALLYFFFLKPSDDSGGDTPTTGTQAAVGGGKGGRPPREKITMDNQPAEATPANTAPAGKNGKPTQIAASFPDHRNDPFYYVPHYTPPPPNVFDEVRPILVAQENYKKPQKAPSVVRVVPNRRVSGLMSGDGVYAILESVNGDVEIVKPGSRTKDGYTVVAINPDSVVLEQEDPRTHTTYTQTVMFSDAPVSSTPGGGNGGNGGNGGGNGRGNGRSSPGAMGNPAGPGGPPPGNDGGG